MFEKDIKEEAEKRCSKYFQENCYKENRWANTHDLVAMYLDGYNKANEWHCPSKGEYPKECEDVWCYCKGIGIKFCCVGHTIIGGDNKVRWWANNKTEELRVIAWKEIVPPKKLEDRILEGVKLNHESYVQEEKQFHDVGVDDEFRKRQKGE